MSASLWSIWCGDFFFFFGRLWVVFRWQSAECEFCRVEFWNRSDFQSCPESSLLVEWLVRVVPFGGTMNDGSAFASPHSWDTGSAESLISWTSHPDCRVSARARKKRHRQSVGEGDEHRRENYIHEGDQIKEGKKVKEFGCKVQRRRVEPTECEMWEIGSGWRRKGRKTRVKAKAARSSYSQTSEQTHGLSLQGVGRKPTGLSRHEMVLHVTT